MSADQSFTLHDLQLMAKGNTPRHVMLEMMYARTHAARLKCVETAIDWVAQEFAENRQHYHEMGEDQLTAQVILGLRGMGIHASHDTQIGGHVDIVIEEDENFLWLGEAKVHSGYEWLFKGFQQLDTRYSTGLPGQDTGGMIIYCMGTNIPAVMDKWIAYLVSKRPDVVANVCAQNPLVRRSEHKHAATQQFFRVRHVPFNLYFKPQDKKK